MKGKRLVDNLDPKNPKEYSKYVFPGGSVMWRVMAPNMVTGVLGEENIIEHDDGTISSRGTIYVQNNTPKYWVGLIDRGAWKESR